MTQGRRAKAGRAARLCLAALAVTAVAVGTAALLSPTSASTAASTGPPALAPLASRVPLAPHARVLVVGDSYTSGYGADPATAGYAYLLPSLTGWQVTVDGAGGTGYLDPGAGGQGTYRARITARPSGEDYDLVLLQGGSNDQALLEDAGTDRARVQAAEHRLEDEVTATVDVVRTRYPRAHVVLLGPVSLFSRIHGAKLLVDGVLLDYSHAHADVTFISPGRDVWFVPGHDGLVNQTLGHPDAAGYALMAHRLVEALSRSFDLPAPDTSAPAVPAPAAGQVG